MTALQQTLKSPQDAAGQSLGAANCSLILGDCRERMAEITDGSVDLTVTSPPYDNLRTYNGPLNDWTPEKWQAIIRELFRVTKHGGVVVWVVGDATIKGSETGTSFRQALYAMDCGFRLHDTMIYRTHKPPMNDKRYQACFEYMFVFSKGQPCVFNALREPSKKAGRARQSITHWKIDGSKKAMSKGGFYADSKIRESIWVYASGNNGDDKVAHPARFPEALARDHILSWSNECDTVFDPFLGSGTTGKMALLHGRKFIGIERDPDYFRVASERISSHNSTNGNSKRQ